MGFDLLEHQTRGRVIICGDSNPVIRQMRGEIDFKAPGLQSLRLKSMGKLRSWSLHEFLHVKRDWSQSVYWLASEALQQDKGRNVATEKDQEELTTLNRLEELITAVNTEEVIKVASITRSAARRRQEPEMLQ